MSRIDMVAGYYATLDGKQYVFLSAESYQTFINGIKWTGPADHKLRTGTCLVELAP